MACLPKRLTPTKSSPTFGAVSEYVGVTIRACIWCASVWICSDVCVFVHMHMCKCVGVEDIYFWICFCVCFYEVVSVGTYFWGVFGEIFMQMPMGIITLNKRKEK